MSLVEVGYNAVFETPILMFRARKKKPLPSTFFSHFSRHFFHRFSSLSANFMRLTYFCMHERSSVRPHLRIYKTSAQHALLPLLIRPPIFHSLIKCRIWSLNNIVERLMRTRSADFYGLLPPSPLPLQTSLLPFCRVIEMTIRLIG